MMTSSIKNFEINLPNANKPKQSAKYDLKGHSASGDLSLASFFQKRFFSPFVYDFIN